jgi:hypothetical protein
MVRTTATPTLTRRSAIVTETPQKSSRWAELSDEVLESVEAGRKTGVEAVRKFVDTVTPVLVDPSRGKTVVDAALDLAEELNTARIEFLRAVVRSAGHALNKE